MQALRNAIRLNRLAQAYLFCGTRGVGKTSMARIFAKCLNCVHGPTENPCQVCDICQQITAGQDVDVIEIDGASNNGVEQVRELRQNVSLRPSRARFKIYYIDEVHMLSTGAFNALLKTLEEPPPHVKFLFATTEANKIPITVLSRCQRYDFAGITPDAIVHSLKEICTREHVEAETEALQLVARRAGGSMRDAQSLLEQLLASGSPKLTVEVVHQLLGTPSDERLLGILEALSRHDSGAALSLLDQAAAEGVQPADLLAGVLEFLRDALMLSVGAGSILLAVTPRQRPRLQALVDHWPTDSILAALQILAEARSRMRGVAQGRLLVELALVRVARLEDLTDLSNLVERLSAGPTGRPSPPRSAAQGEKKKLNPTDRSEEREPSSRVPEPPAPRQVESVAKDDGPADRDEERAGGEPASAVQSPVADPAGESSAREETPRAGGRPALELDAVRRVWPELVRKSGAMLGMKLVSTEAVRVEDADVLVFTAKPGYNSLAEGCGTEENQRKIEQILERLLHRPLTVRYEPSAATDSTDSRTAQPEHRRPELVSGDSMVKRVVELFEARVVHLEYEDEPGSA